MKNFGRTGKHYLGNILDFWKRIVYGITMNELIDDGICAGVGSALMVEYFEFRKEFMCYVRKKYINCHDY